MGTAFRFHTNFLPTDALAYDSLFNAGEQEWPRLYSNTANC
jgi:hypothetical protein